MRSFVIAVLLLSGCQVIPAELVANDEGELELEGQGPKALKELLLGPFAKESAPVLGPLTTSKFECPWLEQEVAWEAKDVFNPAVVVREGKMHMLYRAEDKVGWFAGISRIGYATSLDGKDFGFRNPAPVLYPKPIPGDCCNRDRKSRGKCAHFCEYSNRTGLLHHRESKEVTSMTHYDGEGGCEDPRVVQDAEGTYWMTYTSYDGHIARLSIASSKDLMNWEKHGLAFRYYPDTWSKAGSIVSTYYPDGRVVATRIGPSKQYYMFWGEGTIKLATSDDLKIWTPMGKWDDTTNRWGGGVLAPRPGSWDSDLVEPGPPALLRGDKILLIYNSKNLGRGGDSRFPQGTYTAGQAIFSSSSPSTLLLRTDEPFLIPDQPYEMKGQINNVVFLQGLGFLHGTWFLYYGTADSLIGVATAPGELDGDSPS